MLHSDQTLRSIPFSSSICQIFQSCSQFNWNSIHFAFLWISAAWLFISFAIVSKVDEMSIVLGLRCESNERQHRAHVVTRVSAFTLYPYIFFLPFFSSYNWSNWRIPQEQEESKHYELCVYICVCVWSTLAIIIFFFFFWFLPFFNWLTPFRLVCGFGLLQQQNTNSVITY